VPQFELNGFVMYRLSKNNWGVFDLLDDWAMLANRLTADEALSLLNQLSTGEITLTKEDQERIS